MSSCVRHPGVQGTVSHQTCTFLSARWTTPPQQQRFVSRAHFTRRWMLSLVVRNQSSSSSSTNWAKTSSLGLCTSQLLVSGSPSCTLSACRWNHLHADQTARRVLHVSPLLQVCGQNASWNMAGLATDSCFKVVNPNCSQQIQKTISMIQNVTYVSNRSPRICCP